MIAILCPTKGRPKECLRMINSIAETTSPYTPIRAFLAMSAEDQKSYETAQCDIITPEGMPTAYKWQLLASKAMEYTEHNLFMLGSDDIVFASDGWDIAITEHYKSLKNKIHVYHLQDSRDADGTPHPIVTREYIEAMGYFVPPLFLHWFVDSWTVEIARFNKCFTHFTQFKLNHIKPSDEGLPDMTHTGIRNMGWNTRDAFVAKTCRNFLEGEKMRLNIALGKKSS